MREQRTTTTLASCAAATATAVCTALLILAGIYLVLAWLS